MSEKEVKLYTMAEVRENANSKKPWIVIDDCIYDVTEFLNDVRSSCDHCCVQYYRWTNISCLIFVSQHPGGEEVLLEQAGKDATEEFEDVGHSSDAREVMQKYKIGELVEVSLCSATIDWLLKGI